MKNKLISVIFSIVVILSSIICLLCDYIINHNLSWSLIVVISALFAWLVIIPFIIIKSSKKILCMIISLTIFIIPYLFILSLLLNTPSVFKIGLISSILSLIYLWLLFITNKLFKNKGLICTSIQLALTALYSVIINITTSIFLSTNTFNIQNIICIIVLIILAIICIVYHFIIQNKMKKLIKEEIQKRLRK